MRRKKHAKFYGNRGVRPINSWNWYNASWVVTVYLYFPSLSPPLLSPPFLPFFLVVAYSKNSWTYLSINTSNDAFYLRMCLFIVRNLKFNLKNSLNCRNSGCTQDSSWCIGTGIDAYTDCSQCSYRLMRSTAFSISGFSFLLTLFCNVLSMCGGLRRNGGISLGFEVQYQKSCAKKSLVLHLQACCFQRISWTKPFHFWLL